MATQLYQQIVKQPKLQHLPCTSLPVSPLEKSSQCPGAAPTGFGKGTPITLQAAWDGVGANLLQGVWTVFPFSCTSFTRKCTAKKSRGLETLEKKGVVFPL